MINLDKALTWKDVMQAKKHMQRIEQLATLAKEAGYQYIAWNGYIWTVNPLEMTDMKVSQIMRVSLKWAIQLENEITKEFEYANIDLGPWGIDLLRMCIIQFISKEETPGGRPDSDLYEED